MRSVLAAISLIPSCALAGTFSVPLTGLDQLEPDGDYLTADFDFGTAFSQVDSFMLEFVMPNGYEGVSATTGNSSWSRKLNVVIHDGAAPLDLGFASPPASFRQSFSRVRHGIPAHFDVGRSLICFTAVDCREGICLTAEDCPEPAWPNFVLSGRGRVEFVEVRHSWSHPLPSGVTVSSSTSYGSPGEIVSAQLTIVGTPVPEPSSLVLVICGGVCMSRFRGRLWSRKKKRGANKAWRQGKSPLAIQTLWIW
jgi:hypothetical protein